MIRRQQLRVWVIDSEPAAGTLERLGDAAGLAERLQTGVGVLLVSSSTAATDRDARWLIEHGADHVVLAKPSNANAGPETRLNAAMELLPPHDPRLVIAPGNCHGREWAARLAVRANWSLLSPALMGTVDSDGLHVTALDRSRRWSRRVRIGETESAVITLRDGVAEPRRRDAEREGTISHVDISPTPEAVTREAYFPPDPRTVDIRFANRLVAGGRGLGSKEGFDTLRRFAERIHAGIAASRVAVDAGWIEYQRQVGQTGRTVRPDLYIACGISGASHHVAGMSETPHIVAINTDPNAPIFKIAHLGLVADLYAALQHAESNVGHASSLPENRKLEASATEEGLAQ